MKQITCKSIGLRFISATLGLAAVLLAQQTKAATSYYFDVNGATAGSGIVAGSTNSWEGSDWSTVSGGNVATIAWVDGGFPRFSATPDAAGTYTVAASSDHVIAGMFQSTGTANIVNVNGPGKLSITTGLQGFFVRGGCSMIINAELTGPGGLQYSLSGGTGNGSYFLYGTNTYAGGTSLNTAGGMNFNNNSSFGTGPISWNVASQILADPAATAPITISNSMTTRAASQLIFVSPTVAPVTFSGPWTVPAGTSRLTMNNAATKMTISGIISGTGGALLKDGVGTLVLNGANTYTGGTTVTNGLLEIGPLGSVVGSVNVAPLAGVLRLDNATSLSSGTTLSAASSLANSIDLNFTGTNTVYALLIDGVAQSPGTWGAIGSTAQNQSSIFTNNGVLKVPGTAIILQQPASIAAYPDSSATFNVVVAGDSPNYQWKFNNNPIAGATDSSYTIFPVETNNAGSYSVTITNTVSSTNSVTATLNVLSTNLYVNTIRADGPISFWRLDEATGTLAQDGIGNNNGLYVNATLAQPGFSLTDSDTSVGLPSTNTAARSYVQVTNFTPFIFNSSTPFTLEGWVYFTNLTTKGRLFSTLSLGAPGGFAFGVLAGGTALELTAGGIADKDSPALASPLLAGVWYYLVCAYDGNNYNFYLNGNPVGSPSATGGFIPGVAVPLTMGANPPAYTFGSGDNGAEQIHGRIDEMAIYNYALNGSQVQAHYDARYGSLTPPAVSTPIANPPTNYVSLSSTIQAVAGGQALTYQWYQGATLLAGQTASTLALAPLDLTNNGNYTVVVSNPAGTNTSPAVTLTVLAIPTNAADLNLTSGLVLHLPFDGAYNDISGHNNNGANVGATYFTNGVIGADSLHYFTTSGSTNYVTLGVVPDLQFGSATDFTVSYWVRQPAGSTYTNLPFFTDAIGSTGHGGFAFAPYQTATTAGGWILSIGSMSTPSQFTSFPDADLINDGNWHNLVHVASRVAGVTTYLDGVQVDSEAISFVGNINTTNAATIGQDPTGAYPVTADADLDDLGVWRRTLTPLEVSGLYLAGISNSVSFAPAVTITSPVTISNISGTSLSYGGGAGTRFVLLTSADVAAPVNTWTRAATNAVTPGTFTIPAVGSAAPKYYLIKSE